MGLVEPKLKGRVALVTGGSRGIGREISERFARAGATVVVCGRDAAAAKETADAISRSGGTAISFAADVGSEASVLELFQAIEEKIGVLHVLVNNAGISPRIKGHKGTVEETPYDIWAQTIQTNLTGTFLASRSAIPLLKKAGWGRIINIVSQAGRMYTGFGSAHYSASKAGQIGLSRVLAGELGPFNITVNCISPTRTASSMAQSFGDAATVEAQYIARTPLGRIGKPSDVAAVATFLASEEADFITGTIVDVTGGFFMP